MAIHFIVAGRPTAWQRTNTFKGRHITPKDMREAQDTIAWSCRAAMKGMVPMTGALRLEVLCVYAVPRTWPNWKRSVALMGKVWKATVPDHDNLTKQIGDALNGIAFVDDAQIVRSSIAKRYGEPERTEVRISRLGELCEDSPREAFEEWLEVHGTQEQMKAAGRWLAARRGQPRLPGLDENPSNTHSKKGSGGS